MAQPEQTNVPKLRFPEFGGAWEENRLGEALSTIDAGWSPQCLERPAIGEEWGVLKTNSVVWSGYDDRQNKALPDTLRPRPKLQALKGDILVTRAGPINRVAVVAYVSETRPKLIISDKLMRARTNKQNDGDFVARLLSTTCCQNYFSARKSGLAEAQANISQEILSKVPVKLPPLPEQKKIAAFLGAVDEKLAALRKKRDLLAAYKRGAMQQIFSQKIRFTREDGSAFSDWEEKRLGEVFEWVRTNNLSREFLTYDGGDVQNIHYGDIHTKFKPNFRQSAEKVPFIAVNATVGAQLDDEFCRIGDIVIADASEDYADIGKAIEILEVRERSLVAGLHTYIARPRANQTYVGFCGYLLRSSPMRRQIMRIAQGISVLGISKGNLGRLMFLLPHPDEQQKIADFLSALDAKIDAVAAQITQMEAFKKGLLQQMFV